MAKTIHLKLLILAISSLLIALSNAATTTTTTTIPISTIQRITKQQILASIPPASPEPTVPFLSSPSGKYTAYLVRRKTAPNAGGFGNDFCYMQIMDTASATSVWESECQPLSSPNACSLVFTDAGLSIFDGSNSIWDTGASSDNGFPATLQLVDLGDMRVVDQDGELVWKASDDPRNNQHCGLPGSPGLSPESPPFVQPFASVTKPPFGLDQTQPLAAADQPLSNGGVIAQPAIGAVASEPVSPPLPESHGGIVAPSPAAPEDGDVEDEPVTPPLFDSNGGVVASPPAVTEDGNVAAVPVSPIVAPVAAPIGGVGGALGVQPLQHPFGLQQQQGVNGLNALNGGVGAQPLVDNSPYDSGCSRTGDLVAMGLGVLSFSVVSLVVF